MKKMRHLIVGLLVLLFMTICSSSNKEQTSDGSGKGKHGDIKVEVTVKDMHIEDINVLDQKENEVLAEPVYGQLKEPIISKNSADVDTVSGSTATSEGYIAAVQDALSKAGIQLVATKNPSSKKEKLEATQNYDVVVVGSGGAGCSAAIEAAEAGRKVAIIEKM